MFVAHGVSGEKRRRRPDWGVAWKVMALENGKVAAFI
jgi:hypothetical protein